MNLTTLKDAMQQVIEILDHKHLDKDVPYFQKIVSTTENLAIFFWNQLRENGKVPSDLLYEVQIKETDKNVIYYRGEMQ